MLDSVFTSTLKSLIIGAGLSAMIVVPLVLTEMINCPSKRLTAPNGLEPIVQPSLLLKAVWYRISPKPVSRSRVGVEVGNGVLVTVGARVGNGWVGVELGVIEGVLVGVGATFIHAESSKIITAARLARIIRDFEFPSMKIDIFR
jgi:hypothetical protein